MVALTREICFFSSIVCAFIRAFLTISFASCLNLGLTSVSTISTRMEYSLGRHNDRHDLLLVCARQLDELSSHYPEVAVENIPNDVIRLRTWQRHKFLIASSRSLGSSKSASLKILLDFTPTNTPFTPADSPKSVFTRFFRHFCPPWPSYTKLYEY